MISGWRNEQLDLLSMYSELELYSGGLPGHTTPTVLSTTEIDDMKDNVCGRAGQSIQIPSQFVSLKNLI